MATMNDNDIRRERRAKMLELQRSMDHSGVDPSVRTSAPSVRQVDQFQEQFETADQRKRSAPKFFKEQPKNYAYGNRPREGNNPKLRSENVNSSKTSQKSSNSDLFIEEDLAAEISSVFGDEKEYSSLTSSMGSVMEHNGNVSGYGHKRNNNDGAMRRPSQVPKYSSALYDSGFGTDKVGPSQFDIREAEDQLGAGHFLKRQNGQTLRKTQSFDVKSGIRPRINRPSSHTTKILDEDGNYVDLDDPGYVSSPGSNQIRGDLLSQSLNDWKTRSHTDLTASLRSNDNRLCQEPKKSFKEFLSSSFSKTFSRGLTGSNSLPKTVTPPQNTRKLAPTQRTHSDVPLHEQSHRSPANLATLDISSQTKVRSNSDPLSPNECINLTEQPETKTDSASRPPFKPRSPSPNGSVLTASEFGEVDRRGRSRGLTAAHRARDMFSSSFNGLLIMIPGIGGMLGGGNGSNPHMNGNLENGPEGRWSNQREPLSSYDSYEKRDQDNRQKLPCWTLFLLLAVDIFTIILLVILFSHIHDSSAHCCHQEIDTSRGNPLPLEGASFFPPKVRARNGSIEVNYTQNATPIGIRPRGLDPDGIVMPEMIKPSNQNSTETTNVDTNFTTPTTTTPAPVATVQESGSIGLRGLFNADSFAPSRMDRTRFNRIQSGSISSDRDFRLETDKISPLQIKQFSELIPALESTVEDPDGVQQGSTLQPAEDSMSTIRPNPSTTFIPTPSITATTKTDTSTTTTRVTTTLTTTTTTTTTTTITTIPNYHKSLEREFDYLKRSLQNDITKIVQDLKDQLRTLHEELEELRRPIAFACYKSSPHWNEGVVTYTRCNIPTEGMDKSTGNFHVKKAGVYRLSFTGLFNAQNGHRVTADIMRRNKNNVLDFLGRSAAETNEAGALFGGVDDDIMVTGTVTVLEFLEPGDAVYIQVLIENNHKPSRIHSTNNKAVHFTGQRISD